MKKENIFKACHSVKTRKKVSKVRINDIIFWAFVLFFFIFPFVSANNYTADIYFTLPDSVFMTNERIEFIGNLSLSNYTSNGTLVFANRALNNTGVNLTIMYTNRTYYSNYTFTTNNGMFYSRSNYFPSALNISAPSVAGTYDIRVEYTDPNNVTWFSELEISVVNQTLEIVKEENIRFNIASQEYIFTLEDQTENQVTIRMSNEQTLTFNVGGEDNLDLNSDGTSDVYIKIKSINIISGKVKLILRNI